MYHKKFIIPVKNLSKEESAKLLKDLMKTFKEEIKLDHKDDSIKPNLNESFTIEEIES